MSPPAYLILHQRPMSQTPIDRLRDYLGQLPPASQALLMREFERAIERGQDVAVATVVLDQLRRVVRTPEDEEMPSAPPPRTEDIARLLFQPVEPFLVDGNSPMRPGQIRRTSLTPIWQWLLRAGATDPVYEFERALAASPRDRDPPEAALRKLQLEVADAIFQVTSPTSGGDQRTLARIGAPNVIEDLVPIGAVLQAREAMDGLSGRLPMTIRNFADGHIETSIEALNAPTLQTAQLLPFALSLLMQRLTAPWQIIRIAIRIAASDDEVRVAATPYGMAVTIALHDLFCLAVTLRTDIRRGQFANVGDNLKALHEGVRGLRTELDLRQDSTWGRQLASIRAEISNTLQSEIDSVPGRVRRILRQRPDKDILAGARIDSTEVDDAAALIDFVGLCRTYASELAINEVTLRTYSDLQQYVEKSTEALVQSLRAGDHRARGYRQAQAEAAIRFCEALFGREYASLMSRAVDNALTSEPPRKPSRAG
jgi:hypothetical protein